MELTARVRRALTWHKRCSSDILTNQRVVYIYENEHSVCYLDFVDIEMSIISKKQTATVAELTLCVPFKIFIQLHGDTTEYDYYDIANENVLFHGMLTYSKQRNRIHIGRKLGPGDRVFVELISEAPNGDSCYFIAQWFVGT